MVPIAATIAAYSLIAFCRLVFTPNSFKNTRFGLGVFARPFYAIAFLWNGAVFAVSGSPCHCQRVPDADLHQVYASPFSFPTTGKTFNYSRYNASLIIPVPFLLLTTRVALSLAVPPFSVS